MVGGRRRHPSRCACRCLWHDGARAERRSPTVALVGHPEGAARRGRAAVVTASRLVTGTTASLAVGSIGTTLHRDTQLGKEARRVRRGRPLVRAALQQGE